MNEIWGLVGAALAAVAVAAAGWFAARASVAAASATAEAQRAAALAAAEAQRAAALAAAAPAHQQVDLAILKETTLRLDRENGEMRVRLSKFDALVRAFSRSTDRWCAQMSRAGIQPEPADPLVDEYHRTGV